MSKDFDILGFGEVMMRLSPPSKERISQGEVFEKRAGGSELNVVSGAAELGLRTGIITKLPDNEIGNFIKNKIRFCGVSDDYLLLDKSEDKRLGIYYYESGAHPRKPMVVYDRLNSSINSIAISELDLSMFKSTKVFHVSGISLALSDRVNETAIHMIQQFKKQGALISFDVNYRANLWDEDTARKCITGILNYIDILFVSEETSRRMLQKTGCIEDIMKDYSKDYGIQIVAVTNREAVSPIKHNWSSVIYNAKDDKFYSENKYEGIEVVDRIGSGDAYVAGALVGIIKYEDIQKSIELGNAMAALKNTVPGDMPACSLREIEQIIKSHKNIGVQSELSR